MNIDQTRRVLNQLDKEVADLEKKLADEVKKEADKTKRINDIQKSITKNTSSSMIQIENASDTGISKRFSENFK